MTEPKGLACIDMAGTCITDDGLVVSAFQKALLTCGREPDAQAMEFVRATMGQSKIEVFTQLLGDISSATQATAAFETAYAESIADAALIPGAVEAFAALRSHGYAVWLTTGFSPTTRDLLIESLGLDTHIDGALSPNDTPLGRGRPYPDMILSAALRSGVGTMADVMAVGDTCSDMESGARSGAGRVVGVLTGTHDARELTLAGATAVLDSIAALPEVLGRGTR